MNIWNISWLVNNLTLSPSPGHSKTNLGFFFFFPYLAKAFVFPLQKAKNHDKEEIKYVFLDVLNVGFVYMGEAHSFFTEDKNLVMSSLQEL